MAKIDKISEKYVIFKILHKKLQKYEMAKISKIF